MEFNINSCEDIDKLSPIIIAKLLNEFKNKISVEYSKCDKICVKDEYKEQFRYLCNCPVVIFMSDIWEENIEISEKTKKILKEIGYKFDIGFE